jgi:hypothetical protein
MNVEHRTSNIEGLMRKDEETEIGALCSAGITHEPLREKP